VNRTWTSLICASLTLLCFASSGTSAHAQAYVNSVLCGASTYGSGGCCRTAYPICGAPGYASGYGVGTYPGYECGRGCGLFGACGPQYPGCNSCNTYSACGSPYYRAIGYNYNHYNTSAYAGCGGCGIGCGLRRTCGYRPNYRSCCSTPVVTAACCSPSPTCCSTTTNGGVLMQPPTVTPPPVMTGPMPGYNTTPTPVPAAPTPAATAPTPAAPAPAPVPQAEAPKPSA